jgi:hypothetical protein
MKTKESGTVTERRGGSKSETKSTGEVKSDNETESDRNKSDGDVSAVCRSLSLRFTDSLPVQLQVLNSGPSTLRSTQCTFCASLRLPLLLPLLFQLLP